jgi:hypothetical protein
LVRIEITDWRGDPAAVVPAAAQDLGLAAAMDGSLRSYPGSRHWHLRNGSKPGTLEVAYWPEAGRLWISYHENRTGDGWVADYAPRLARILAEELSGKVERQDTLS